MNSKKTVKTTLTNWNKKNCDHSRK